MTWERRREGGGSERIGLVRIGREEVEDRRSEMEEGIRPEFNAILRRQGYGEMERQDRQGRKGESEVS